MITDHLSIGLGRPMWRLLHSRDGSRSSFFLISSSPRLATLLRARRSGSFSYFPPDLRSSSSVPLCLSFSFLAFLPSSPFFRFTHAYVSCTLVSVNKHVTRRLRACVQVCATSGTLSVNVRYTVRYFHPELIALYARWYRPVTIII